MLVMHFGHRDSEMHSHDATALWAAIRPASALSHPYAVATGRRYVQEVMTAGERARAIVNQILTFSRATHTNLDRF